MTQMPILILNAGSSSLKFSIFDANRRGRCLLHGAVSGIATHVGEFTMTATRNTETIRQAGDFASHEAALRRALRAVSDAGYSEGLVGVGHRVAHGGPDCDCPKQVSPALLQRLRSLVPLAPLHLPANIQGIEAVTALRPDLVQLACFDTAFHSGMPGVARMTGLPRALQTPELRRYGYHGLSYEYIVGALRRDGVDVDKERIVVAHLGNGASLAAIRNGRSIETTMGFSTISGVPMGTRSGDIDPGLLLHLQTENGLCADEIEDLLTNRAGLLGLSGVSRDMRVLLRGNNAEAGQAIRYFCYHIRRHLVSLTAPLEGLDRVVFTGGIGAHAAPVRELICSGLDYLGITLDAAKNHSDEQRISASGSRVVVEVRQTNEEAMIAEHVQAHCEECTKTVREAS